VGGTWQGLNSEGNYVTKLVFWRQGFDWVKEPRPELVVTAARLDAKGPSVAVTNAQPAFIGNGPSAMMIGLGIPGSGCWQITAHHRGASLEFVVSVKP
jgi:hypothetical protein